MNCFDTCVCLSLYRILYKPGGSLLMLASYFCPLWDIGTFIICPMELYIVMYGSSIALLLMSTYKRSWAGLGYIFTVLPVAIFLTELAGNGLKNIFHAVSASVLMLSKRSPASPHAFGPGSMATSAITTLCVPPAARVKSLLVIMNLRSPGVLPELHSDHWVLSDGSPGYT